MASGGDGVEESGGGISSLWGASNWEYKHARMCIHEN